MQLQDVIGRQVTTDLGDGQTACIRLNGKWQAYSWPTVQHKFLVLSLEGAAVEASTSGSMHWDQDDIRGWYVEQVDLTMKLNLNVAKAYVYSDSPTTTMGASQTTSSTALSVNLQAGTFGDVPTTGGSVGVTIGSSYTRDMTDFKILNTTTQEQLHHTYKLAASSGGAYDSSTDLLDMSTEGQFTGTPLFRIPDIAIANLPIMSQGIWVTNGLDVPDTSLVVGVTVKFVRFEKTFEFFRVETNSRTKTWSVEESISIPLGQVTG